MANHQGLGVLISQLSGAQYTTALTLHATLNRIIVEAKLDKKDNRFNIKLDDGSNLSIFDDGQSCCEARYMVCDDKLGEFIGARILDYQILNGPDIADNGEEHEQQFFNIKTDKGVIQLVNHNEHNGYYGGFSVVAKLIL